MNDNLPTPLLTVPDLSNWLRIKQSTIRKWVCYNKIPYIKVGRSVCFDRHQIEKWLEKNSSPMTNTL